MRLVFRGNEANEYGGALDLENDQCQLRVKIYFTDSLFEGNLAKNRTNLFNRNTAGGAISIKSSFRNIQPFLYRSQFRGNVAVGGEDPQGGALYLEDCQFARLIDTVFENNTASSGGAVYYSVVGYELVDNELFVSYSVDSNSYSSQNFRRVFSINGSHFIANNATRQGGAISLKFQLTQPNLIR